MTIRRELRAVTLRLLEPMYRLEAERKNKETRAERGRIAFAPFIPRPVSAIAQICRQLGWAIEGPERVGETSLTMYCARSEAVLPPMPAHWINGQFVDHRKTTVATAFDRAFGHGYEVDPRLHSGVMVRKANKNAAHNGEVIEGPEEPRPGSVYLRLINNVTGGEVEDVRMVWMRGLIPIVYLKYRPIASRFSNLNTRVEISNLDDLVSPDEATRIGAMCQELGMDYGEIDALRDRDDGRLYVIDMNRSPSGPPNGLAATGKAQALQIMSREFAERFATPLAGEADFAG